MKLLTATLVGETRVVPPGQSLPGAGLRCVLTNLGTQATSTTPVQTSPVFTIGPFVEGSRYRYEFQSVDSTGKVIGALQTFDSTTPGDAAMTYWHPTGITMSWADA